MGADVSRLARRLGVQPRGLAPFERYDDAQLQQLDTIVGRAMEAEDKAFDAALEEALRFVPRLLRGTAQKLLFPGGRRG
ncbi:MAG TPA: hypothetical protein VGE38_00050 [Nocardioides sp.]|uniref:hypothetical protein n=1 Tax=Nocardioides sp. TaxID=35761 RepID=UPI002ED94853